MNKSIEQDLNHLLPSLTGPIPAELVQLAVSILAQSKSRASSLRAEEEIARGYACAHIACERLREKLDLPKLHIRPPVPPRVYKKVFEYISTSSSTASTPRRDASKYRQDIAKTPVSTPSKLSRTRLNRTPQTSKTPLSKARNGPDEEPPKWVMPAIRTLCKAFKRPDAAPHVFAGLSSVLKFRQSEADTPSRKRKRQPEPNGVRMEDMSALIAVITFYTLSQLDKAPSTEEYIQHRKLAIQTLTKVRPEDTPKEDEMIGAIERFLREAQDGWLDMEWYQNIPTADSTSAAVVLDGPHGLEDELADEGQTLSGAAKRRKAAKQGQPVLRGGFGTMFNDSTDWLSEDRKAEYIRWKKLILSEIDKIESQV